MRIEERGLPPFLNYINARLGGRPLLTAIWLIVMLITCALVYILDPQRGIIGNVVIAVSLLYALIVVAMIISTAIRAEGRRWLLDKHSAGNDKVSIRSRLIVRLLPLIGVLVVFEYMWLH